MTKVTKGKNKMNDKVSEKRNKKKFFQKEIFKKELEGDRCKHKKNISEIVRIKQKMLEGENGKLTSLIEVM